MYRKRRILCVIPARAGSKGLPGKNIKKMLGRPLIMHTINQAKASKYIDRVIVSTDSRKIAAIAGRGKAEVPFIRPKSLATDKASMIDVLSHAVDWMTRKEKYNFDILVLLHVTNPLRKAQDIDKAIRILFKPGVENVFSVTKARRNPYFNMVEINKQGFVNVVKKGNFTSRQDAPEVFDMDASIYAWWKDAFRKKKGIFLKGSRLYVMPRERSIDIDDYLDFEIAETLLSKSESN